MEENGNYIAPCGVNCQLCYAFQREKNKCNGCNSNNDSKPYHCQKCSIKFCDKKNLDQLCYECSKFPCTRLKELDKRYQTKYHVSLIENLNTIKLMGLRKFILADNEKWKCKNCSSLVCIHQHECYRCKTKI